MPQSSTTRTLPSAARSDSAERSARRIIFLGVRWRVVAGLRAVRDTAAAPVRRADRALAGATGALLAPRLRATAGDLGARLGAVRAGAGGGELRGDDLVHDRRRSARCRTARRARRPSRRRRRPPTSRRASCCTPLARLRVPGAFAALRTNTRPPFGPGHRALDEQQAALGVALDDLEVQRGDPRRCRAGRPSSCP